MQTYPKPKVESREPSWSLYKQFASCSLHERSVRILKFSAPITQITNSTVSIFETFKTLPQLSRTLNLAGPSAQPGKIPGWARDQRPPGFGSDRENAARQNAPNMAKWKDVTYVRGTPGLLEAKPNLCVSFLTCIHGNRLRKQKRLPVRSLQTCSRAVCIADTNTLQSFKDLKFISSNLFYIECKHERVACEMAQHGTARPRGGARFFHYHLVPGGAAAVHAASEAPDSFSVAQYVSSKLTTCNDL